MGFCQHGNEPSGSIKDGQLLAAWATDLYVLLVVANCINSLEIRDN
jgi:hypothetical protein